MFDALQRAGGADQVERGPMPGSWSPLSARITGPRGLTLGTLTARRLIDLDDRLTVPAFPLVA
jgi:hypothetical protein